jgi:lysophospholipase L1-like esterase
MAKLFNQQRAFGVKLVPDGTTIYNNRPVIGIRDASGSLFIDDQLVVQADTITDGRTIYNDQPVVGAVLIADGRKIYNNARVMPVKGSFSVPLPALPLAAGAKIAAFGHSFVGLGAQQAYLASQAATNGHQGFYQQGRAAISWVANRDGRFNIDMFSDLANPFFAPNSFAAFNGAMQGKSGETLTPDPSNTVAFPGTLTRTDYVIARGPAVVYLDIGYNDITKFLKPIAGIIADYDLQVKRLTDAGIYVILQTLSWSNIWAAGDSRYADVDTLNTWIVAQAGRNGVRVCNTLALDGPASGIAATMFVDGLHPQPKLMALRAEILLGILQSMVQPGETRSLDPLAAYNIFPAKGLPGTAGTKTNTTGNVATGMRLIRGAGTSTYVGSKEVVAAGNEKQVVTVTPVDDGVAAHTVTFGTTGSVALTALGIGAGDWLEINIPIELDDWAGWDYQDSSIIGPVLIANTVTVTGGGWKAGNSVVGRNMAVVSSSKLWLPPGLAMTNIRADNLVVIRHLSNVGGTGVVKIGAPIFRKISDPRAAWNL